MLGVEITYPSGGHLPFPAWCQSVTTENASHSTVENYDSAMALSRGLGQEFALSGLPDLDRGPGVLPRPSRPAALAPGGLDGRLTGCVRDR